MGRISKFPEQSGNNAPGNKGDGKINQDTSQTSGGENFGLQFLLDSGESIIIPSLPVSIGREGQNDFVFNDDTVSSTHARIYFDDLVRDICIVDLDSLNGIFVNEKPTRKNLLFDGTRIRLGNVNLTFRDTGYIHPG